MDIIQGRLLSVLEEHDFRGCGRSFNRTTLDGLIHVITFQVGTRWSSDQFTVNLGIHIPELCETEQLPVVREVDCAIRARLGELDDEPDDIWWLLEDHPDLTQELRQRFSDHAMPLFEKFRNRPACLRHITALAEAGIVDADLDDIHTALKR